MGIKVGVTGGIVFGFKNAPENLHRHDHKRSPRYAADIADVLCPADYS